MAEDISKPRLETNDLISNRMGKFWRSVRGKDKLEAIWEVYLQIASSLLNKLYQIDREVNINDILSKNLEFGGIISLQDNPNKVLNKLEIDDELEEIPELHSSITYPKTVYYHGEDYEVIKYRGKTWIDFTEGSSNSVITTEDFNNDGNRYIFYPLAVNNENRVYKKYGKFVEEKPPRQFLDTRVKYDFADNWDNEELNWDQGVPQGETDNRVENDEYVRAIKGLWYALHFGPTIENIRIAIYLLHGLPVNKEEGVISFIKDNDEGDKIIGVNGEAAIRDIKFTPKFSMGQAQEVINGSNYTVVELVKDDKNINITEAKHLREIYKNAVYRKNYRQEIDADNYAVVDGALYLKNDFLENNREKYFRLIYETNKSGEFNTYNIGNLTLDKELGVGDGVERFDIFTEEIEVQDMNTPGDDVSFDRDIEGTRRGIEEWNRKRKPPGLYKIWLDNNAIAGAEIYKNVAHFLNKFEPIYSHFEFEISNVPFLIDGIGHVTSNYLEDVLDNIALGIISFREDINLPESIDVMRTKFKDDIKIDKEQVPIFWDRETYYQRNVPSSPASVEFQTSDEWDGGASWDNQIQPASDDLFWDMTALNWDEDSVFWDQGTQIIEHIWDWNNTAPNDTSETIWDDTPGPDWWDWEQFFI